MFSKMDFFKCLNITERRDNPALLYRYFYYFAGITGKIQSYPDFSDRIFIIRFIIPPARRLIITDLSFFFPPRILIIRFIVLLSHR